MTVSGLSSTFYSLIQSTLESERQPLYRLETERDTVNVQRSAYLEAKSKLESLQTSVKSLISTNAFSLMSPGRTLKVTPTTTNTTVLTASTNSSTVVGNYNVSVSTIAKAERFESKVMSAADKALGITGTFLLGGDAQNRLASISSDPSSVLTSASTGDITSSFRELGTGAYTLQTRTLEDGTKQFRLVDADNRAVSVASITDAETLTSDWQTFTTDTTFDTGRGLVFQLSGSTGSDAAISYTAKGASVSIAATDTLIDIANKINSASQAEGHDVSASVVDKQLILTAANTGTNHAIQNFFSDVNSLFSLTRSQSAANAVLSVNNISLSRQSNSNLTDIIPGITINLAADAEGKSAAIAVSNDNSKASGAVNDFVSKMNSVLSYIDEQTSITKVGETYQTGPLYAESSFGDLRSRIFSTIISEISNSGSYRMLSEIGISFNDSLQLSVDSTKLESALSSHFDDTKAILDTAMNSLQSVLSDQVGAKGYLANSVKSMDIQMTSLNYDINDYNKRLTERQAQLEAQYADLQSQLIAVSYMSQSFSAIYGSSSRYT